MYEGKLQRYEGQLLWGRPPPLPTESVGKASLHHYSGSTERAKVSEPNFYKLNPAAGAVLISNVVGSHE